MFIFRVAKAENHLEDRLEKDKTNGKASSLSEGLSELDAHDDIQHEVRARKKRKESKHRFHVQDLEHGIGVIDRDKRFPAIFSGFLENLPLCDNDENDPSKNKEDHKESPKSSKKSRAGGRARRNEHVRVIS